MALTVTAIDPVGFVDTIGPVDEENYSPLYVGQNIYAWGNIQVAPLKTKVYKSTNGGVSFAAADNANSPSLPGLACAVPDPGNNRILFAGQDAITSLTFLQQFNLLTDTWGPRFATGGPGPALGVQSVRVLSNGDIYVITITGAGQIQYAVFSGGAWSGLTNFSHLAGMSTVPIVIQDSSDGLTLVYTTNNNQQTYARRLQGGVLGAVHSFPANPNAGGVVAGAGLIDSFGNIRFGYILPNSMNPATVQPQNWTGTPVASPAWVGTLVDTDPNDDLGYVFLTRLNTVVSFFWIMSGGSFFNSVFRSLDGGGGYGPRALFYNCTLNPPAGVSVPLGTGAFFMGGLSFITNPVAAGIVRLQVHAGSLGRDTNTLVFVGSPAPPPSPIVTLTFKGQKVYS